MADENILPRDQNHITTAGFESSSTPGFVLPGQIDEVTGRVLVDMSGGGTGDVVGPASSTDNAAVRFDGTTGKIIQNSVVIIGDTGNVTGLGTLNTLTIPASNFVGISDSQTLTNKTINGASNTLTVRLASDVTGTLPATNGGTGQSTYTKGDLLASPGSNTLNKLAVGADGTVLTADAASTNGVKWSAVAGTGDVVGPASATDNAITRFDGTTGKLIQNSAVTVADTTGVIAGTQGITFSGTSSGTTSLVATAIASGIITLPAATDTLVGKATTDTLTNKTLTTPVINGASTGTGVSATATASTLVLRDANANALANNLVTGFTTTTNAGATTTLTAASTYYQTFTGASGAQTLVLPVASTLSQGWSYFIDASTSINGVIVQSSGGNTIVTINGGFSGHVTCILTSGTTAASWTFTYWGVKAATGKGSTVNNSISFSGTDGTTMTFPTTSATIARTDAANTFTGTQTFSGTVALGTQSITMTGSIAATGARVTKGWFTDIESTNMITIGGTPLSTAVATFTNKRNQPRTASTLTASTLTPDLSSANVYYRTTQTATLTINAPTGTPILGEVITIYVDSVGAQTLTIDATYIAFGTAFPAATTAGKTFMLQAQYNGTNWKSTWASAV